MILSKIPTYQISTTLLINSNAVVANNLFIPISIDKSQQGSSYLYVGKKLVLYVNEQIIEGTYQIKAVDNTEYLLINNINELSGKTFNFNDVAIYNEIEIINSENDVVTITDIHKFLLATKNNNGYKGKPGLITPNQVEAIETLPYEVNMNTKFFSEIITNTILFYHEKNLNENFMVTFQLKHSLFNAEYTIKTFGGSNFTIKQNRFSSSLELNNLSIDILVNKINNNSNTKSIYQFVCKLSNIPTALQTNVEKVIVAVNIPSSETLTYSTVLPVGYVLTNSQILITTKQFNRNILYYDINGLVSVKDFEEIKLTGLNNLNLTWTLGNYYYDTLNINDIIFNNIPGNIKNIFYLEVKRLSNEIMVQQLHILDTTNNIVKRYSRFRNSSTSVITVWTEYVTSNHKHLPSDITTDSNNQFVTAAEKATWNSMSVSQFWKDAVALKTDLPLTTNNGDTRLVLSENKIYRFNTVNNQWILLNNVKIAREILSDKIRIKVNEGLTDQVIELPFVTTTNPGIVPTNFYSEDYQNYFEQQLNFTSNNAGSGVPSNYNKPLLKTFNIIKHTDTEKKIYDGIQNYIIGDGINTIVFDFSNGYSQALLTTIYTKIDNNNMLTGIVAGHSFSFNSNGYASKFIFPQSANCTVISNGSSVPLSNNELIPDTTVNYLIDIILSTNTVTIIKISI